MATRVTVEFAHEGRQIQLEGTKGTGGMGEEVVPYLTSPIPHSKRCKRAARDLVFRAAPAVAHPKETPLALANPGSVTMDEGNAAEDRRLLEESFAWTSSVEATGALR